MIDSLGDVELNTISGIAVRVPLHATDELKVRAMVLGQAIRDEGYESKVALDQTIPEKTNVIRIMIGAK
jgi:hypothetical protein